PQRTAMQGRQYIRQRYITLRDRPSRRPDPVARQGPRGVRMLEMVPSGGRPTRRRALIMVTGGVRVLALLLSLTLWAGSAATQSTPPADWSEADLAAAAALRDRALKGTSAYDHV